MASQSCGHLDLALVMLKFLSCTAFPVICQPFPQGLLIILKIVHSIFLGSEPLRLDPPPTIERCPHVPLTHQNYLLSRRNHPIPNKLSLLLPILRVFHIPPPLNLESICPPRIDILPLFAFRQSCRSLQELPYSRFAHRSGRDSRSFDDVDGVVACVSVVELRGGHICRRRVLLHE